MKNYKEFEIINLGGSDGEFCCLIYAPGGTHRY